MTNGTSIKTTDYLDGFQYNEQVLEFFPTTEGYVKATPTGLVPPGTPPSAYAFNYVFNYTDHLGNVRVSYTKDPQTGNLKILDESHYYPFGLKHQEYSTFGFVSNPIQGVIIAPLTNNPYKYKYNGKEWQDELNFNMYDMDMRQYDPAIARWVVLDPVIHHSMSPYSAFDNNPVFWADPSGADSEFFSAFPDQNIAHYGTSNTIDIANIIEANQKMENTMQMIKALIKLAEDYGGKNSKSGGEPNNGDPKKGDKENNNEQRIRFSKGKTKFRIQEVGVTYTNRAAVSGGEITITSPKGYYFEKEEIISEGLSYGVGEGVLPGSLFSASAGDIVFDQALEGNSLLELFSTTHSVEVMSGALIGFKGSIITGYSSSGKRLWHSYGMGGEGNVLSGTILRGNTEWKNQKQGTNSQERYETIKN